MLETEPRARTARFDAASSRIVVDLSNGCSFAFPARLAQGLEDASPEHWPKWRYWAKDTACIGKGWMSISASGLLAGLFGTNAFMDRQRAASAGASTSQAKADAARRNLAGKVVGQLRQRCNACFKLLFANLCNECLLRLQQRHRIPPAPIGNSF